MRRPRPMPSSSPADEVARVRRARESRLEKIVEHLRRLSVDSYGLSDVAAAIDLLVDIKFDRALYMRSSGAELNRSPNISADPRLLELDEQCEAARINLRRMLARHGAGR